MPKITELISFNPKPTGKLAKLNNLNKKNNTPTVQNLKEYVEQQMNKNGNDAWESFMELANEASRQDEPTEPNTDMKTMRFYRMMSQQEAVKWLTMSLKHSRCFSNSSNDGDFYVRFTVDVSKLSLIDDFAPENFIVFASSEDKHLAKMINMQRTAEGRSKLNYFETQLLEGHKYAKVNISMWPEQVKKFNECLVQKDQVVLQKLKMVEEKEGKKEKLYRFSPLHDDLEEGESSDTTQRSETSLE